jgi:hypothetical protein
VAGVVCIMLMLSGSPRAPLAAPQAGDWTPDMVRRFVLGIDRLMDHLYVDQDGSDHPDLVGNCRGYPVGPAMKRSEVLSRMHGFVGGRALNCYLATYLGCNVGGWIGRPVASEVGPKRKPFKKSKVTIIEQTRDRVIADVTEIPTDDFWDGDAKIYLGEDDVQPYTDAEIAEIKDTSRYTITRVNDWMWQISDRKPSFEWSCSGALDKPDPPAKSSGAHR